MSEEEVALISELPESFRLVLDPVRGDLPVILEALRTKFVFDELLHRLSYY